MVVEELPPLPAAHRAALIRVGREALRNAAKHAPDANVTLTLGAEAETAFVTVADDGPGFDPASPPQQPAHGGGATAADRVTAPATSSTPSRTTAGANETAGTG
jgi:signal transduction histidine kinase